MTIEWQEKKYGKSELSRRDALLKRQQLKRAGYVVRVVYGNDGQFIVQWHIRPAKKIKAHKNSNRRESIKPDIVCGVYHLLD